MPTAKSFLLTPVDVTMLAQGRASTASKENISSDALLKSLRPCPTTRLSLKVLNDGGTGRTPSPQLAPKCSWLMGRLSSFAITLSIVLWLCLNSRTFGSDPMAVRIDDGLARYRNEISKIKVACMAASKFPSEAPGTMVMKGPSTTLKMQDVLVVGEERLYDGYFFRLRVREKMKKEEVRVVLKF